MRNVVDEFKTAKNKRTAKLIYLYAIKYDNDANQYLRWTSYGKTITFNGQAYTPYVITHDSIADTLSGKPTSLTLKIANVDRYIQAINDQYNLIEKEVTVITVSEEELSNPQAYVSDTFYVVDVIVTVTDATIRLSSSFDVMDVRVPRRYFFRAYCRFKLKDAYCQYAGEQNDCNKTLQRCRELENTRHFGAFPSIPAQKLLVE